MNSENFNVKFGEVINTGGTSDFNNLSNRPKYDNEEMTGETNIPKVPTTTSELTNDSGFITGIELEAETTAREQADNTLQGEIDGLDNSKADKSATYTKTEVDTALDAKADKSTTYTKTEVDTALEAKADKSTTYTKTETEDLIGENAGKIKVLTTDDYNWPVDNPTGIAPWLLDEGWYTGEDGVRLYQSQTGSTYITLFKGKTFYIGVGTGPGGEQYYRTKYIYRIGEHGLAIDNGVYRSVYAWITWFANDGSGAQHIHFPSLADLSERVVRKAGAPTSSTEGDLGQLWEDSRNGELYQLKSIDTSVTPNTYTWEQVGGGGGGPTIVQTTGTSTTDVMSQNAVTSMIFNDPGSYSNVAIGTGVSTSAYNNVVLGRNAVGGSSSVAIGGGAASSVSAQATGNYAVAVGANSMATASYSIAFGWGSRATVPGQFDIGTSANHGYNSSNYRLLTGLYDPQGAHDAATKGYVDPTTDSSAPTTATAGRLGEIRIDTTTNTAYMCVVSDSTTPVYEWKQITA